MKDLIKQLVQTPAPAGSESLLTNLIKYEITAYADEISTDVLGNLHVVKRAQATTGQSVKTLLLTAHMDEPGITVVDIDEGGFLRIAPLGRFTAQELVGRRVKLVQSNAIGVIAADAKTSTDKLEFAQIYIDLGVSDQETANQKVQIGDAGVLLDDFQELDNGVLLGRTLAGRIACAVAIETIKQAENLPFDLHMVFTVQHNVGARGIQTAAYRVNPDLAMVLGAAPAEDIPQAVSPQLRLGKGVAIKALDANMVVPSVLRDQLIELAETERIPYQIEVAATAKSDGGALQVSRNGIPTCGLSVPVRYLHAPTQLAHLDDAEAMLQLVKSWLLANPLQAN